MTERKYFLYPRISINEDRVDFPAPWDSINGTFQTSSMPWGRVAEVRHIIFTPDDNNKLGCIDVTFIDGSGSVVDSTELYIGGDHPPVTIPNFFAATDQMNRIRAHSSVPDNAPWGIKLWSSNVHGYGGLLYWEETREGTPRQVLSIMSH